MDGSIGGNPINAASGFNFTLFRKEFKLNAKIKWSTILEILMFFLYPGEFIRTISRFFFTFINLNY